MMNRTALAFAALLTVAFLAQEADAQASPSSAAPGREVTVDGGKYTDLTVPEFRSMAEATDFLVVNVHVPFEGNLPGTEASIPFHEIAQHIAHVAPQKDAKILLYCRSGRMSATAAAELAKLGYPGIHNLVGGFNAWVSAGHPMAER